jgi:ligand-binding sensor protein
MLLEQIKIEFPVPEKTNGVISQSEFIKFCQNIKAIPKLHTRSLINMGILQKQILSN